MTLDELRAALERDGWDVGAPTFGLWATHPSGASVQVFNGFRHIDVTVCDQRQAVWVSDVPQYTWGAHKVYAKAYKVATKLARNRA